MKKFRISISGKITEAYFESSKHCMDWVYSQFDSVKELSNNKINIVCLKETI